MLSAKDVSIVYETLLCSPGMNEPVKVSMIIPRKQILLLTKVIEAGLSVGQEGHQPGILSMVDNLVREELQGLSVDLLKKAGLTEMNDSLNVLLAK